EKDKKYCKKYLNNAERKIADLYLDFIRATLASVADMAIIPMQDLLELDSDARLNTPSSIGINWQWRATEEQISKELAKKIYKYAELYGRLNPTK
ncbi:MAG: 4-alpha-glucanotransferase, partial [Clostridium sp.]|nr:4-alpha-glucanotransferase [Clostridium sp.]